MIADRNNPPAPLMELVLQLERCCETQLDGILARAGLSPSEFTCIRALPVGESVASGALAARMGLSPSRGSRVVERLVRGGMLTRTSSDADRRVSMLALSERGRRLRAEVEDCLAACEEQLRRRLDHDERAAVERGLGLAIRALKEGS